MVNSSELINLPNHDLKTPFAYDIVCAMEVFAMIFQGAITAFSRVSLIYLGLFWQTHGFDFSLENR